MRCRIFERCNHFKSSHRPPQRWMLQSLRKCPSVTGTLDAEIITKVSMGRSNVGHCNHYTNASIGLGNDWCCNHYASVCRQHRNDECCNLTQVSIGTRNVWGCETSRNCPKATATLYVATITKTFIGLRNVGRGKHFERVHRPQQRRTLQPLRQCLSVTGNYSSSATGSVGDLLQEVWSIVALRRLHLWTLGNISACMMQVGRLTAVC